MMRFVPLAAACFSAMPGGSRRRAPPHASSHAPRARDEVGRRDGDHGGDHHRRRAGRAGLEHGADDRRSDSATARRGRAADRTHRRHAPATTRTTSTSASSRTTPSRERVIGTQMARDASLASDDRIEILLDTFRDQRSAFYFATNPSGALVDGLVANGQLNADWDAIWDVRTRRTDQGWIAEFAIPFKSLSFPAGRTVWGFNIARTHLSQAGGGPLVGRPAGDAVLSGVRGGRDHQSRGPDAGHRPRRPAVPRRPLAARRRRGRRRSGKPGLDVFYNITPSLKLTATFNTDFGETEVDARQINLSRFSVLFPEKRSFFLRGRRRLQLRQHRARSPPAASRRPAPTCIRSSAGRSACSAGRKCRSMPASS